MATVLLVDDEETLHFIFESTFQKAGYQTLVASDGKEALDVVSSYHPNLVILDDMMPKMSGSEVCMRMKSDPDMQHIPVIMCSAGSQVRNPEHIRKIRADAAVPKPVRMAEMLPLVSQLLASSV
jgi:twitching motility two-component system response regulator PilH